MKNLILSFIFISANTAVASNYIDLMPLELQYRYEDTTSQSKDNVRYESLGVAVQVEKFRIGIDLSKHRDQSGNASLNTEFLKKDILLILGYQIYEFQDKGSAWQYSAFVNGIAGSNQSEVNTSLLGNTTSSVADQSPIFGLGVSGVVRIKYFMAEVEVRALNSKGFSPATVYTSQLKLGLSFSI
jgi:hypothetical protein